MFRTSHFCPSIVAPGSSFTISGCGRLLRLLCLLSAIGCVLSVAPPTTGADVIYRHPPMLHVVRHAAGDVRVVRLGARPGWSSPSWPQSPSPVDQSGANKIVVYAEPDDENREEPPKGDGIVVERSGMVRDSNVRLPRRPVLPHLLGSASSGGIRKTVTTPGREEEKRWAPTEIRMNEFIHKIRAVNAASRLNRRFHDDNDDTVAKNYDWWAHRVRRQRQQQADGAKAAQALQLYGLRTRMGE